MFTAQTKRNQPSPKRSSKMANASRWSTDNWDYFHGIPIGPDMPYYMGAAQIALSLAIMLGVFRTASYALGFVAHGVTVVVVLPSLLAPFVIEKDFPVNRNQAIALAALVGFAALWLLRHRDCWSVDAWWASRRSP